MKFGETLSTHLTPEWRKQYISYTHLKKMILKAIANAPLNVESSAYTLYIERFDEDFFEECEKELFKIDMFFAEKLAEAKRKSRDLETQVKEAGRMHNLREGGSFVDLRNILSKRKTKHLKLALSEFYLSLVLLKNYQTLNQTGFRKILKKYDKKLNSTKGNNWYKKNIESALFVKNDELKALIEGTEKLFTNSLEDGNRARAMKYLRVPPFEELHSPWSTFRLGFSMGILTCLLFFLFVSLSSVELTELEFERYKKLHRGPLLLILYLYFIGLNVYGWQKAGVNHILIFEINPRDHLRASSFFEMASYFGILLVLSFLGCLYKKPSFIPTNIFPLSVFLIFIVYWLNPFPLQWKSRFWLMKVIGRILSAPFYKVGFADFWLADQITSLSQMLIDFQFVVCFFISVGWAKSSEPFHCTNDIEYITSTVIYALPSWWRLLQSLRRYYDTKLTFPFLVNAGKYATAFPVAGFKAALMKNKGKYDRSIENPYFWGLVVSRTISTTCSYSWDILMDFSLFKKFSGENIFLRDGIIYASVWYYLAIIEDFVLRYVWILAIVLQEYKLMGANDLVTLLAIAETLRRFFWNYFRLENEHLNNAGRFRAVRDISVRFVGADGKDIDPRRTYRSGGSPSEED